MSARNRYGVSGPLPWVVCCNSAGDHRGQCESETLGPAFAAPSLRKGCGALCCGCDVRCCCAGGGRTNSVHHTLTRSAGVNAPTGTPQPRQTMWRAFVLCGGLSPRCRQPSRVTRMHFTPRSGATSLAPHASHHHGTTCTCCSALVVALVMPHTPSCLLPCPLTPCPYLPASLMHRPSLACSSLSTAVELN